MVLTLDIYIMFNKLPISKLLWIFLLFAYFGSCFRFDRPTEVALCKTQCKALCIKDSTEECVRKCHYTNVYHFWLANCDDPALRCFGSCQVIEARSKTSSSNSSRTTSKVITNIYGPYDASDNYPPVPHLRISAIAKTSIVLAWDLPNSDDAVFFVVQIANKSTPPPQWVTLYSELEGDHVNITLPGLCMYEFRVMAINKYGSNGFSPPISVKNVPLEPIHNITFAGRLIYNQPTAEITAVIQWSHISDFDDEIIANYNWNDISMVKCPRLNQNQQPIFEKYTGARGRKFVLMRVNREAYGCVFTTQIKATSVCHDVGGWTNFTVNLTDCNKIDNFDCPLADISTPGHVQNVTIHVDRGQSPILVRLNWITPTDKGSLGVIDHYEVRWGPVTESDPNEYFINRKFIGSPNLKMVKNETLSAVFPIETSEIPDHGKKPYGFQIIPYAPTQIFNSEFFPVETIQIYKDLDTVEGTLIYSGEGVKVVQLHDALDINLVWNYQLRTGMRPSPPYHFHDKYAVSLGRRGFGDPEIYLVDGGDLRLSVTLPEPGLYYFQIYPYYNETDDCEDVIWEEIHTYNFSVKDIRSAPLSKDKFKQVLGIILPTFLVLLIPFVLIFIRWLVKLNRLKKKLGVENRLGYSNRYSNNNYVSMVQHPLTSHYYRCGEENRTPTVVPDKWELPACSLKVGRQLGSGAFGQVLKGRVSQSVIRHRNIPMPRGISLNGTYISVAVKMLKDNAEISQKQDFLREITLMKQLGMHVNLVSMLGCCTLQDPICLVVEHLPYGDMKTYLNKIRENLEMREGSEGHYINKEVDLLSPTDLLSFARQIAVGMEFLSINGFIHRDLAARNILVGCDKVVKIGDFGLTRLVLSDQVYVNTKGGKFPIKWMSIEAIKHLRFSTQSDVWSFGVVLFEIVTLGGTPYPTIDPTQLLKYLSEGNRMEQPQNCSLELYNIMLSCWQEQPSNRPTFSALKETLENMLLQTCGREYFSFKIDRSKQYYNVPCSDEATITEVASGSQTIDTGEIMELLRKEGNILDSVVLGPDILPHGETPNSFITIQNKAKSVPENFEGGTYCHEGEDDSGIVQTKPGTNETSPEVSENQITIKENVKISISDNTQISFIAEETIKVVPSSGIRNAGHPCNGVEQEFDSDVSPCEPIKLRTRFAFKEGRCDSPDEKDYEADDSSLSEISPSAENRDSFSSNNGEEVFSFPEKTRRPRRYHKEKHPRFKTILAQKVPARMACRQESNMTDSGISTSSYTDMLADIEILDTRL